MGRKTGTVRRERARDDGDAFDVPAAILCAFCGQADCPGCTPADDQSSGVMAIVPWERPGAGVWSRLWATATASTQGADTFFAALPDGDIPPAVRFAILAEMLAVSSMVALFVPLAALVLPNLALEVMLNPVARSSALRWVALGIPALALWMVIAHATHGAALDVGARRHGGRSQRTRALRFGLYACGWDLMAGPLGAVVVLATKGLRAMAEIAGLAMRVPGKASDALLQGVYGLSPDAMKKARRSGTAAAVVLAIVSAFGVLAAIALL